MLAFLVGPDVGSDGDGLHLGLSTKIGEPGRSFR
jgi:hypothetical protein